MFERVFLCSKCFNPLQLNHFYEAGELKMLKVLKALIKKI